MELLKTSKLSKDRVVIPAEIRRKLNLKDGDTIVWVLSKDGNLSIKLSNDFRQSTTGQITVF